MARTNKKLSKAALSKCATRHNWGLQWCWNYERMQASGFAWAMVPVMKELYDTDEEVCSNLERHMQFYNTHPGASAPIIGACAALEEDYQTEMSDSLKVALMGPFAGIGDTIQAVLVQALAYIIGASLANDGNWALALLVTIVPLLILFLLRWPLFNWGYKRSTGIIEDATGNSDFNSLREGAQILGITVVGGFVPSMIGVKLAYEYSTTIDGVTQTVKLQDTLDGVLPYMLPIVMVGGCYLLLKKVKLSPVKVIGIVAVVAFVLGALGILG